MSKRAVVVVDIQNEYFPSGKLPLVGIADAAANAAKVIEAARSKGDQVIYVRHESAGANAPIFSPGSTGVEINSSVRPRDGEPIVLKHYPNAFRKTDLKQLLDAKGIEEVVIVGAMSHMCIDATSRAAADLGYSSVIVHDACATMNLEFNGVAIPAAQVHAAFMAGLAFGYGKVMTTSEYLA
jgi:nicotinamidase-related amidase